MSFFKNYRITIIIFFLIVVGFLVLFFLYSRQTERVIGNFLNRESCQEKFKSSTSEQILSAAQSLAGYNDLSEDDKKNFIYCVNSDSAVKRAGQADNFLEGLILPLPGPASSTDNFFVQAVALGDLEDLCPEKITNFCNKESELCPSVCQRIEDFAQNREKLSLDLIVFDESAADFARRYAFRAALTYRLIGEFNARSVCHLIKNETYKNDCLGVVSSFSNIRSQVCQRPDFVELGNSLKNSLCQN